MLNAENLNFNIRMNNFIIFEPASQRIREQDILLRGDKIVEMFSIFEEKLYYKTNNLEDQILVNRLTKINKMLDLITNFDNVIMTKFFDRVWRRYSYLSNLGETFLDIQKFLEYFPEYKENTDKLVAARLDDEFDEFEIDHDIHEDPVVSIVDQIPPIDL